MSNLLENYITSIQSDFELPLYQDIQPLISRNNSIIKPIFIPTQLIKLIDLCNCEHSSFNYIFNRTIITFLLFIHKKINDKKTLKTYYDNCQFLYLIYMLILFDNNIIEFKEMSLFKISNNVPLINDISVYNDYDYQTKNKIINIFYSKLDILKYILTNILEDTYTIFNPEYFIYHLTEYLKKTSNRILIGLLACEFNGNMKLNIEILQYMDIINEKWINDEIKPQTKLRIIVLYIYISKFVKSSKII